MRRLHGIGTVEKKVKYYHKGSVLQQHAVVRTKKGGPKASDYTWNYCLRILPLELLFVAIAALGWSAFSLVAILAERAMSSFLVDFELRRGAFMAGRAALGFPMGLVVKSDSTVFRFVLDLVGGIGDGAGKSDQHGNNDHSFHSFLLEK
jgi:hypothetical protein